MAKNLTEVDTFTANVTVPEDGDARNAASVETPFQALANRTLNSKNRLDGIESAGDVLVGSIVLSDDGDLNVSGGLGIYVDGSGYLATASGDINGGGQIFANPAQAYPFGYTTAKSFVVLATGVTITGDLAEPVTIGAYLFFADSDATPGRLVIPQPPDGATITRIRAAVNVSTTPTSQQLELEFSRLRYAKTSPFAATQTVAADLTKATSGDEVLDSGAISVLIDRSQDTFVCLVTPGQDGASGCDVTCHWIELTFTMPGPVRS